MVLVIVDETICELFTSSIKHFPFPMCSKHRIKLFSVTCGCEQRRSLSGAKSNYRNAWSLQDKKALADMECAFNFRPILLF